MMKYVNLLGFFLECGGSSAPKDSAHLPDFV